MGEGSYSDKWGTNETELGDYYAEATLTDTSGNMLDRETAGFSVRLSEIVERSPETIWKPTEEKPTEFPSIYVIIGAVVVVIIVAVVFVIRSRKKA